MAGRMYWVIWSKSKDPENIGKEYEYTTPIMAKTAFDAASMHNKCGYIEDGYLHVFPEPETFSLEEKDK